MSQGVANLSIPTSTSSKVSTIFSGDYAACDEGSFFTSTLAITASNAVATVSTTTSNANPIVAIQNQWPIQLNAMSLYLRYIRVVTTTVQTSASVINYTTVLDPLQTKLTTVGTAMGTPVNANQSSSTASKAALWSGVNVAAAPSANARLISSGQVIGQLTVAFDEFIFHFGQPVWGCDLIGTETLVKRVTIPQPPVIVGPQWWFTLGLWGTSWGSAAAPSYQIEVGWIERPSGQ